MTALKTINFAMSSFRRQKGRELRFIHIIGVFGLIYVMALIASGGRLLEWLIVNPLVDKFIK